MIEESVHEFVDDSSAARPPIQLSQNINQQQVSRLSSLSFKQSRTIVNQSIKKTIKISAQKCEKSEKEEPPRIKQCRICLQGQQQGRMIRPCICSGSVTYAHQKCITEWIKRKHDPKSMKGKLECQMCNTPFKYKSAKRRALDKSQFYNNYQKEKCNFILFYLFVSLLFLVAIGIISIIAISNNDSELGLKIRSTLIKSENIRIIYICVVFILFIVLMFLTILFIVEYAVKSELVITQVMNYCDPNIKRKYKVHPRISTTN